MTSKEALSIDLLYSLNEAAIISKTDLNDVITFVNEEFCRTSGYCEDDLIGKTHAFVNSHTHPTEFFQDLWSTITQNQSWHGEICNRAKTGETYWIKTSIFPIEDQTTGLVASYICVGFDITEKVKREQQLQSQKMQYDLVTESTDGFWHLDEAGNFVDVSECYCHLSGYSESELLLLTPSDVEAEGHKGDLTYQLSTLDKSVDSKVFESMHQRKDGTHWFVEILISYYPKHKNFYVFLRDISKRKSNEREQAALQQQLNHLQKLESIGRLTAGIAHDFNNILASILGYNELNKFAAEDLTESKLKGDILHNSSQVDIAGSRAADLIKKMLTYCRQGEDKQSETTLDLSDVLNKILIMLQEIIPATISIEVDLLENTRVTIDETDLYQIIVNLFVNARDALDKTKGTIKLNIYLVDFSLHVCSACREKISGKFVEIKISDSGSGIDSSKLTHIFDPFFTTKDVGKGTGLGLSVVSGIIHNANGHVVVDSEIGRGTTFKLFFPR